MLLLVQLTNTYGSPTMDDIERIARGVNSKLIESLGEEAAGQIEVGMSSPVRYFCMRLLAVAVFPVMHGFVLACCPVNCPIHHTWSATSAMPQHFAPALPQHFASLKPRVQ